MASATLVPLETYLQTTYRPDCDYVDGELKERPMGEWDHGRVQGLLFAFFLARPATARVATDVRVQIAPTRFRVPDVVVLRPDAPDEQIITHPPLIVIEILSPADSLMSMRERINDYRTFGIANIWVVDPSDRMGYICHSGSFRDWQPAAQLAVPGTDVVLDLTQLPA